MREILASLGLALCVACQTASPTTAQRAETGGPTMATSSGRALLEAGDFRQRFVEVARSVRPSVVSITAIQHVELPDSPFGPGSPFDFFFRGPGRDPHHPGRGRRQERRGTGSGVIIDAKGTILTNNHVVADADELKVVLHDDRELRAKKVGTDPKSDVAVIRVVPEDLNDVALKPAALGDDRGLEVGEWVMAIGSPFGLKQTVSAGIVSAKGRARVGITDYEDFIQTDAAINPGNSGGPLVNLEGAVVGINTAIASRSGGSQGIGFAIPISMARNVATQLIEHGRVVRGYLGVFIGDLTPALAESFGFAGRDGVLIQDVTPGGPGDKAGLRAGDIIFERDGVAQDDAAEFRNGIAASAPGTEVALKVWRDGKEESVRVKLGELPGQGGEPGGQPSHEGGRPSWGLGLRDVDPEAQRQLGLKDTRGALVAQVTPDSSAARAGLRPGDLIVSVAGKAVTSAADAQAHMRAADPKRPLRLRVVRGGHGLFVLLPPAAE